MQEQAREYVQGVVSALTKLDYDAVEKAAKIIEVAKTVYVFGNGGSAATAAHFQNDLFKMAQVLCRNMVSDIPLMTAFANDISYQDMFSAQLFNLVNPGDVIVGISCSGDSPNVIHGFMCFKDFDVKKILLTGEDGGKAQEYADVVIRVDHEDIRVQEDVHLAVCHCIAGLVRDAK